jgi:hypothetical protein
MRPFGFREAAAFWAAASVPGLAALTGLGLIERLRDPLDGERSGFVIVKPIARLHHLVIAPHEAELAAGQAESVWADARAAVDSRIYRSGFAAGLAEEAAARSDVELVGLERIYRGA